jgi:hypothetical protein
MTYTYLIDGEREYGAYPYPVQEDRERFGLAVGLCRALGRSSGALGVDHDAGTISVDFPDALTLQGAGLLVAA